MTALRPGFLRFLRHTVTVGHVTSRPCPPFFQFCPMSLSLTFDVVISPYISPYIGIFFRVWELVLSMVGSLNSQRRDTHNKPHSLA